MKSTLHQSIVKSVITHHAITKFLCYSTNTLAIRTFAASHALVMWSFLVFGPKTSVVLVGLQVFFSRRLGPEHVGGVGGHARRSANHVLFMGVVHNHVVAELVSRLHTLRFGMGFGVIYSSSSSCGTFGSAVNNWNSENFAYVDRIYRIYFCDNRVNMGCLWNAIFGTCKDKSAVYSRMRVMIWVYVYCKHIDFECLIYVSSFCFFTFF